MRTRNSLSTRILTLIVAFTVAFSMMSAVSGSFYTYAASPYWKNFKAKATGNNTVKLSWKKLSKKQREKINGIAVFCNGKLVKRIKKTAKVYTDKGLKPGKKYRYQLKTYKKSTKKVTKYWNKKTNKWQTKKIKGAKAKRFKRTRYTYKNTSGKKTVRLNENKNNTSTSTESDADQEEVTDIDNGSNKREGTDTDNDSIKEGRTDTDSSYNRDDETDTDNGSNKREGENIDNSSDQEGDFDDESTAFQNTLSPPKNLRVTYVGSAGDKKEVLLEWDAVENAGEYKIYTNFGEPSTTRWTSATYVLEPGKKYTFSVSVVSYRIESIKSKSISITLPPESDQNKEPIIEYGDYPVDKTVECPGDFKGCYYGPSNEKDKGVISLYWDTVAGADFYRIYTNYSDKAFETGSAAWFYSFPYAGTYTFSISSVKDGTESAKSKAITVSLPASKDEIAKTRYSYDVMFFNQPYSGNLPCSEVGIYIKTNNPDYNNFEVCLYDSKGEEEKYTPILGDYFDLPLTEEEIQNHIIPKVWTVSGGYVKIIKIETPGEKTIKIKEFPEGFDIIDKEYMRCNSVETTIGEIMVIDGDKEYNAWMDDIISKTTTDDMTKSEKMESIMYYLRSTTKYRKNYIYDNEGHHRYLSYIVDLGIPDFVSKEWDSYTSPITLVDFGEKIGYPLHNMYFDYPEYSDDWYRYHFIAKSIDDGTTYSFCQGEDTNFYENIHSRDDVEKVDCLSYDKYYCCY